MPTTQHMLLVMTTLPDLSTASVLAHSLLEARLAACVSVGAPVQSVYRWQGAIVQSEEYPLQIKTTQARYTELQAAIEAVHPYEVPEIIAVPITEGMPAYLNWIGAETTSSERI